MTRQESQELARLAQAIETLVQRAHEDREHRDQTDKIAARERRQMRDDLHKLAAQQAEVERRLAEVEPVATMMKGWRARAAGGLMVLGLLGTIAGAAFALFREQIAEALGLK